MHVKAGETVLYRACDLNDVALVRRLLTKGVALNPSVGLFDVGPSIWCRQDSESNTILHRAVLKKYDIEIIDVILKADSSVTKVKDSSNRLPVEVVLHSKGDNDEFLFEDLPLVLVCKLFERMKAADLMLVIDACSSRDPTYQPHHQQRYADFRVLASSLQQVRSVRSINVHLLGFGCAGKSTLRAAFKDTLPNPSKVMGAIKSFLGYKRETDHIDIKNRTIGCEVETIEYQNQHWRFFDYGGQEMFHANHDRFLKLPASLYIIVVPLCDFTDPKSPCFSTIDIHKRYKYWLRFLASIFESDTVVEIFTVLNGKRQAKAPFVEEVRKMIFSEQKKWVTAGRALSKDQQEPIKVDLEPRLRFVNTTTIPCIDNNRLNDVRNEMNDVLVETIARVQREATLYPKLLAKFEEVKNNNPPPVFLGVVEFKHRWLALALDGLEASPVLKEFLKDWMLLRLQTLKEVIVVNENYVLTNSNWLSSNVLGEIIFSKQKSDEQKSLLTTQHVSDLIKNDSSNDQLRALQSKLDPESLAELLESVGACVRVNTLSHDGSGNQALFFPMMKSLTIASNDLQPIQLDPLSDKVSQHTIKRKFKLVDSEFFSFPPGYFERLFAEIVSLDTRDNEHQGIRIETYENALRVKSGESIIVQTIVITEGDEFYVTVTTLMSHADYAEEMRARGSLAKSRLTSICDFILARSKPEVTIFCSHPTDSVSKPLDQVVPYLKYEENRDLFDGVIKLKALELKLEKRFDALRRAINETAEVTCPYCFVLTPEKLGESKDQQPSPSSSSSSYFDYLKEFMQNQWDTLTSSNLKTSGSVGSPQEPSELWFYLLDQFTMTPIILPVDDPNSDRYPIKISEPNKFLQKCYPVVSYSLSLLKGVNNIGVIARLLGFQVPDLKDLIETADRYVTKSDDHLHRPANTVLAGSEEENASKSFMRGFRLKELAAFYEDNNCKEIASICKLFPVLNKDGYRVWTVEMNKEGLFQKADVNDGDGNGHTSTPTNMGGFFQKADGNDADSNGNTSSPAATEVTFECFIWEEVRIPLKLYYRLLYF